MKLFLLISYAFLSLGLFYSNPLFAKKYAPLKIYTEIFPPYNYEEDGVLKGVSVEVVREIMKILNIKQKIEIKLWSRGYFDTINKENVFLFSMIRTADRENQFQWIGTVAPYKIYFYEIKKKKPFRIADMDALKKTLDWCY